MKITTSELTITKEDVLKVRKLFKDNGIKASVRIQTKLNLLTIKPKDTTQNELLISLLRGLNIFKISRLLEILIKNGNIVKRDSFNFEKI